MGVPDASVVTMNSLEKSEHFNVGGGIKAFFEEVMATFCSSDQMKGTSLPVRRVRGRAKSANFATNLR